MARRVFISYKNDDESVVNSYCELIEENQSFVKIMIGRNLLTLPFSRVLKIKEAIL